MLYKLTETGNNPISLKDAKGYLKIDDTADDTVIRLLLTAVIEYAEQLTGRDYRTNTWKLFLDNFEDRICLRKSPVDAITLVQYTLAGTLTTIVNTVYVLKIGHQFSEVLLQDEQEWPTDGDDVETTNEHTIEITFTTEIPRHISEAKLAMLQHLAFFYQNRGDCDVRTAAEQSGADKLYDHFRIERI